jgi:rhodanese-related sulfurtransferase
MAQGYRNVAALLGGVESWKKTGFPMAAETPPENPLTTRA